MRQFIFFKKFFILCSSILLLFLSSFNITFASNLTNQYDSFNDDYFLEEDEVYLGGYPIGLDVKINGCIVTDSYKINLVHGQVNINENIHKGDIIVQIEDTPISCIADFENYLKTIHINSYLSVRLIRDDKLIDEKIVVIRDDFSNSYKCGLTIKDNVMGIGTMTYIKQNGDYGALGHNILPISNLNINGGNLYDANIIGIEKGCKGKAGRLKGNFVYGQKGNISKSNNFGVYGKTCFNKGLKRINVASRNEIKSGKAFICSSISGINTFYEVDILKNNTFSPGSKRNMIIKVIDTRLLNLTNGIVQGMSGSPIIQNNKLIGAVTHVFLNDSTKGYGLSIDCMINN